MKTPTPIIVVPVATSAGTLSDLRKAGYVPLLCDEPEKVLIVMAGGRISGDDLLMSALHAMTKATNTSNGESVRSEMVMELHRRMKVLELEKAAQSLK
jgi:hypothetical protein